MTPLPTSARLQQVLEQVLAQGASEEWRGHDKHDGLNSPLVWTTCGWSRITRLFALQMVMRSPIDLRELLAVPKVANPKGLALFIQALIASAQVRNQPSELVLAHELVDHLDGLRTPAGKWSGQAWGYQYPWQDLGFFAPRGTPNAVVTSFVVEAMLDLHAATGASRPLDLALEALPFLRQDLPHLVDTGSSLCLGYMPVPMRMRVMDVSILIASVYARCERYAGGLGLAEDAKRLVHYVLEQQTAEGAWWYTDPPKASPVRIDNYHTGFILDALWRYMEATADWSALPQYQIGLAFYAGQLFEADGAPRWMSDQRYPHDVHGSAQGIITFARHRNEYPELADRIAGWALDNLYDGQGRFWYRRTRTGIDRRFFLRWNNGWMARALSDLLLYQHGLARNAAPCAPPLTPGPHHA